MVSSVVTVRLTAGFTTTFTVVAGLSQPETVWVTYNVVVPAVELSTTELEGVNEDPTPTWLVRPASLYHRRPVPVAVSVGLGSPTQIGAGSLAAGAAGAAFTVITTWSVTLAQPFASVTVRSKAYTPAGNALVVGLAIEASSRFAALVQL